MDEEGGEADGDVAQHDAAPAITTVCLLDGKVGGVQTEFM